MVVGAAVAERFKLHLLCPSCQGQAFPVVVCDGQPVGGSQYARVIRAAGEHSFACVRCPSRSAVLVGYTAMESSRACGRV